MAIITLTTDFGPADHYVAAMKGVILSRVPDCRIIDATHQIKPQDVKQAALVLGQLAPYYPAGTVHVAVVDPGVGGERSILAGIFDDQVFVADQGSDRIDAWQLYGDKQYAFDTEPGGDDLLHTLETLAIDPARGRLFASSEQVGRVEVFDLADGDHLGGLCGPQSGGAPESGRVADVVEGIIYDRVNDRLYVSDEQNQRILVFDGASSELFDEDSDFGFLGSFGAGGDAPGEFLSADGIAVDPALDRLAVADQGNQRVQVFRLSDIEAALGL